MFCENFISMEKTMDNYEDDSVGSEDLENTFKFSPPLYRQRYQKVIELLLDQRWTDQLTSLVDFGCSELKLFILLKNSTNLKQIALVDVDEVLLEEKLRFVSPLTGDYFRRRKYPLKVSVFTGSVTDPDYRLLCYDVVTAVELIEHLYPDEVEAFTYNIFHYIAPKIVIITTPNADFNVVFSNDPNRFRHFDHKFEWTREQFQEWATNVVERFSDYQVSFFGIGEGPEGSTHIGECSQMAVFLRKDVLDNTYQRNRDCCNCNSTMRTESVKNDPETHNFVCTSCVPNTSFGICTYENVSNNKYSYKMDNTGELPRYYFKLLKEVDYPYDDDHRTDEEKLIDEIRYRINNALHYKEPLQIGDISRYEIPLNFLLRTNENLITIEELELLLKNNDFVIENCINRETESVETCVIISEKDEESSSDSDKSLDNDDGICDLVNLSFTNWDEDEWDRNCESTALT